MLASPLENHWINITADTIESITEKPTYPIARFLGDESVLLPATVNAHTHLELSQLLSPLAVPSRSMPDWVEALLAFRRSGFYDASKGIDEAFKKVELLESIAVADVVPFGVSLDQRKTPPIHWLSFIELIGWKNKSVDTSLFSVPHAFGYSPHAPQTVCVELLETAIYQRMPIAMHLAETQEELQLLREQSGPMLEMMRRADPDYDPKSVLVGKRPLDYLQLLSTASKALIIHGNYLDDEEMRFLADHRETMSVVFCPRSHAYFRHAVYPLKKMLDYGVRVVIGTDSLASSPDLSLLAELQSVLKHHPAIPLETIYRLGTLEGANALGLSQEGLGTIQIGKPCRFLVLNMREYPAQ